MQSSRRAFLAGSAGAVLSGALAAPASAEQIVRGVFTNGDRPLSAFPQKRPLMVLTPRPPQLETPFAVFDQGVFTPNDAFFVRWHLADIPTSIGRRRQAALALDGRSAADARGRDRCGEPVFRE